jgi:hypothetical protein
MSNRAVVNIVDVYPDAVRDRADQIVPGCKVFDAYGDRYEVIRVRRLVRGRTKITRKDGFSVTWADSLMVTFVPRPAREVK